MSDLVFLLLVFFIFTSALVAPNAIKLMLPGGTSKTIAKQDFTINITENRDVFIGNIKIDKSNLDSLIAFKLNDQAEGTIVLKADRSVPVEDIVSVIDAVNNINQRDGTSHKVILATFPK
jgi:biopolymer transport protein ExbD